MSFRAYKVVAVLWITAVVLGFLAEAGKLHISVPNPFQPIMTALG